MGMQDEVREQLEITEKQEAAQAAEQQVVDIEETISEMRRKKQEEMQAAAEAAKEEKIRKFNEEDAILFRAFKDGAQKRMIDAMNRAADEQMQKMDQQVIQMFANDARRVHYQPGVVAVPVQPQKKKKKVSVYHAELGCASSWFIAAVLFLGLIARLLGMA